MFVQRVNINLRFYVQAKVRRYVIVEELRIDIRVYQCKGICHDNGQDGIVAVTAEDILLVFEGVDPCGCPTYDGSSVTVPASISLYRSIYAVR